jgi:hypothetical protein
MIMSPQLTEYGEVGDGSLQPEMKMIENRMRKPEHACFIFFSGMMYSNYNSFHRQKLRSRQGKKKCLMICEFMAIRKISLQNDVDALITQKTNKSMTWWSDAERSPIFVAESFAHRRHFLAFCVVSKRL